MKTIGSMLVCGFGLLVGAAGAFADGTEALGTPSIAISDGSGVSIGGVGLLGQFACPQGFQAGDITVEVPAGATVNQVLLYWQGVANVAAPDDSATVDGNPVTGTLIGGPSSFTSNCGGVATNHSYYTYRADITGLGLIAAGSNTVTIDDLDGFDFRVEGAGLLVIWDDGSENSIDIRDGQDFAFFQFNDPLDATEPVVFDFAESTVDRVAYLPNIVGSVQGNRPNVTEIITNGPNGEVTTLFDIFSSNDGPDFDTVTIPVTIPAGSTSLSIEIISADGTEPIGFPASLAWIASGLVIEEPEEIDCGECDGKVTHLELEFLGSEPTQVKVIQRSQRNQKPTIFDQLVNPGDIIVLDGVDNKGTLGPEIEIYENGLFAVKIHTSCSQPIGPGLIRGNYLVVAGESRNGGELCPVDEETNEEDCECDGQVTYLTLQYNGASTKTIVVTQKVGGAVVFNASVDPGAEFTFSGNFQGLGTLGPEIVLTEDGANATNIHTSCSQPIGPGLVAGNYLVIAGASRNKGELCPLDNSRRGNPGAPVSTASTASATSSSPMVMAMAAPQGVSVASAGVPKAFRGTGFAGDARMPLAPVVVDAAPVVKVEPVAVEEAALVSLELQYLGSETADITVMQIVDQQLVVIFDEEVQTASMIALDGVDTLGGLGASLYVYENGVLAAEIKTGALQAGQSAGNFEVLSGQIAQGGAYRTL